MRKQSLELDSSATPWKKIHIWRYTIENGLKFRVEIIDIKSYNNDVHNFFIFIRLEGLNGGQSVSNKEKKVADFQQWWAMFQQ